MQLTGKWCDGKVENPDRLREIILSWIVEETDRWKKTNIGQKKQSSGAQKKIVLSSIVEKLVLTYKLWYHDEIQRRKTMMKRKWNDEKKTVYIGWVFIQEIGKDT